MCDIHMQPVSRDKIFKSRVLKSKTSKTRRIKMPLNQLFHGNVEEDCFETPKMIRNAKQSNDIFVASEKYDS